MQESARQPKNSSGSPTSRIFDGLRDHAATAGANFAGCDDGQVGSRATSRIRRMTVLDLHGDMGQVGEFGQSLPVIRRLACP